VPLRQDWELECAYDEDVASDDDDALAQPQVVIVGRLVGYTDEPTDESRHSTRPASYPAHAQTAERRYRTTRHSRVPPS
jgi:hypothetical protein